MAATALSQPMQALALADQVRCRRSSERAELRGKPKAIVASAVIDPTPELASYRLRDLFAPTSRERIGLLVRFGDHHLNRAFNRLAGDYPLGRSWHSEIRLRDLSRTERERLVGAIFAVAPNAGGSTPNSPSQKGSR
jgi:hypothetical protein